VTLGGGEDLSSQTISFVKGAAERRTHRIACAVRSGRERISPERKESTLSRRGGETNHYRVRREKKWVIFTERGKG